MSKISFFKNDITYGKFVGESMPSAILVPQGRYTHFLFNITFVPASGTSDDEAAMHQSMPEHYEAERIEMPGTPDYSAVVQALIGTRYTSDVELSVINNHLTSPTDVHEADFVAYQQWRSEAKKIAREAVGIHASADEIMAEKVAEIDSDTDRKILREHIWNGNPVWLSSENQFNYKAAFDIAVQTNGQNLPITFKLGENDGNNIYHTFESVHELQEFYLSCVKHINDCLMEGWTAKEGLKKTAE